MSALPAGSLIWAPVTQPLPGRRYQDGAARFDRLTYHLLEVLDRDSQDDNGLWVTDDRPGQAAGVWTTAHPGLFGSTCQFSMSLQKRHASNDERSNAAARGVALRRRRESTSGNVRDFPAADGTS